ncbi:MAG: dihydrolipoyl dehydrogenase [Oscillospiraceae bacterium]|nr:dihydrolipoyl dehydrogenase [Oscillospiraceae bacterium]
MKIFDVLVIGGGPGGYCAAERAAAGGRKVALFEERALGGVCLNEGCVPSKTLLNAAKYYDHARHGDAFGVTVEGVKYDHAKVVARKDKVVKTLVAGVGSKMKGHKVTVVKSRAIITGKGPEGFTVIAEGETYAGKKLIIATGSEPSVPPIGGVKEGLADGFVLTNREILDLTTVPKQLVVIGGGVIGLEMAAYFQTVGSKVLVVETLSKIAGPTDDEISALLQKELEKKGVTFALGAMVTGISGNTVTYQQGGKTIEAKADKVLLSTGRRPTTAGLGLETIGVYVDKGAVVTDHHLRTNVPDVYAIGDANGKWMLAHTAYREAEVAVNHMLGKRDYMRYFAVPSVIYTSPEVACVGDTEETAKARGVDVDVVRVPMAYSGRWVAETHGEEGLCKLIVEKRTRKLLGVHMICSYAGEIIYGATLMLEMKLDIDEIKELIFPHPTVGEVIREGLFMI